MSAIVTSTEVDRPADEVFAYATDPTRFVEWQGGVTGGHLEAAEGRGPQMGDVCVTTRRIGGAERGAESRLVIFDPPRSWAVRGTNGPIRALVDLTVVPLSEDRSRLTISVDFQGHGIGRILVPLMVRREARKEMPVSLATLKANLEA
jgi:Polyketide cyclase / dehydrase and lipid transport